MHYLNIFFKCIEVTAFVLPALPNNFYVRLLILSMYAYLHIYGYQYSYASFKQKVLTNNYM
jgi:hypothetical protein